LINSKLFLNIEINKNRETLFEDFRGFFVSLDIFFIKLKVENYSLTANRSTGLRLRLSTYGAQETVNGKL